MGDWTQIKGRFFDSTTGAFDESAQARWFATATGRIGVTMTPQALLYAKGGAAWVNNRYQDIQTGAFCGFGSPGCNQVDATTTTTRLGWTVGIGAEYMFAPNWSVFGFRGVRLHEFWESERELHLPFRQLQRI
jgi:outer membrane immunogenic protein